MAWFVAGGRAGRTVGDCDGVAECHHQGFAVQAGEADVQDVRLTASRIAVDLMLTLESRREPSTQFVAAPTIPR